MTGWPDETRPGVPLNPERGGWHWVAWAGSQSRVSCAWWRPDHGWAGVLFDDPSVPGWHYLGPCLLPSEVAAREAAARREGIEVLAELLRWFGKYPEFIPHPDHANKVDAAIKRARALLDAQPDADLARDYHAWTEGRSDER